MASGGRTSTTPQQNVEIKTTNEVKFEILPRWIDKNECIVIDDDDVLSIASNNSEQQSVSINTGGDEGKRMNFTKSSL